MSNMLPCPFCGTARVIYEEKKIDEHWIHCDNRNGNCDCTLGPFPTKREAVAAWNFRNPSAEWIAYPERLGCHWALTNQPNELMLVRIDKNGRNLYVEYIAANSNSRIRLDDYIDIFQVRGFSPIEYPALPKEESNEKGGNQ